MEQSKHHSVIIVGGGTAGTTVAASLLRKQPELDLAIIEPRDVHYYQPAFTLVGGGCYDLADTARPQAETLPARAKWIRRSVTAIEPDQKRLRLDDNSFVGYEQLVVCPGMQLNWSSIEGLTDTLGYNGVCSNYEPALSLYTWQCLNRFQSGKAIFTQPATPIKCAGAPQKITYLAADLLRKRGLASQCQLSFHSGMGALFSVPDFVPYLEAVAQRYEVGINLKHNLVAVDGKKQVATFEVNNEQGESSRIDLPFDLLHVTPPQSAPDFVRASSLANDAGWVEVDQHSLQHTRYPEVFALGDASSLPTSKTAAAVRKQAPVLVNNLLAYRQDRPLEALYDGYTSCPLVTGYGRVILAEFVYGAQVAPTLPLNPFKESSFYWQVKKRFLPPMYWYYMLKGREGDIAHHPRPS